MPRDESILQVLLAREGSPSSVILNGGTELIVVNIVYGYDLGDAYAHVTTNICPEVHGHSVDVFSTESVAAIVDPVTQELLTPPS